MATDNCGGTHLLSFLGSCTLGPSNLTALATPTGTPPSEISSQDKAPLSVSAVPGALEGSCHTLPQILTSITLGCRLLHLNQLPAGTQYSHLCFFRISDNPYISSFGASSLRLGKEEASHRKGGDSTSA